MKTPDHKGRDRSGGHRPQPTPTSRRQRIARRKQKGVNQSAVHARQWLTAKQPVLRAVLIFLALLAAFYTFEFTHLARGPARRAYLQWIANTSARILIVMGHNAKADGTDINSPRFSVKIVPGCDALDPAAAFVAAVIASPVSFWTKIPGLLIGTASLLLINLFRVVSLFFIGIHFPAAFKTMHHDVWQAVFVVLAVLFWFVWVQWATRPPAPGDPDSA